MSIEDVVVEEIPAIPQPIIVEVNIGEKIPLSFEGNVISINDGETIINLEKKAKDLKVTIDYSFDEDGLLTNGTTFKQVMQIIIPAKKYINVESTVTSGLFVRQLVPFNISEVTIRLWCVN